jgi:hypothetical protein
MNIRSRTRLLALTALAVASLLILSRGSADAPKAAAPATPKQPSVDFNRQVRPILSEFCFACHGPDQKQRKARLRFDTKEGAFAELRSGSYAIVPGKPDESMLLYRITAEDAETVMPPPKTGKKMTPQQIAILRQWIEQGATWTTPYAFTPPKKSPLPKVSDSAWPRNPIDHFILARLDTEGLQPAPEATRTTLLRRVTIDLTGLPPTPAEVDAFLADKSPDAYEKVVERLLGSPRYGEHMARFWFDAARYGDTHGLHLDNYREIWPYRDWVINAFNANMPYDRFVTEQLAGDLLPTATVDQQVATGFIRCHVTTSEGGSIEEEWYVRNVVDMVDTTGTVFLGTSIGCARCHDHKYDPIKMKDYYSLFAFFNSIDGGPLDGNAAQHAPVIRVASREQLAALEALKKKSAIVREKITAELGKVKYEEPAESPKPDPRGQKADYVWIDDDLPPGTRTPVVGGPNAAWTFVGKDEGPVLSGQKSLKRVATGLSQVYFEQTSSVLTIGEGDKLFAHVWLDPKDPPRQIMLQWHSDSWRHRAYWGENLIDWGKDKSTERLLIGPLPEKGKWVRLEVDAAKVGLNRGATVVGWAFTQFGGTAYWDKSGLFTATPQGSQSFDSLAAWVARAETTGGANLPKPVQDAVKVTAAKRTDAHKKLLRDHFLTQIYSKTRPVFEPLNRDLAAGDKEVAELEKKFPTTLVFKERSEPRPAFILKRGEYDQKGEKVERATPPALPPFPSDAPKNRLGLARWLLLPEHPTTARVAANRLWQQIFGTGLVKTAEDFGVQGEPCSHPELLDYLAVQFREDGWDVKKLMRLLVTSATYRQASRVTPEKLAKDPANRLLARGPRFRLDAEEVRDQALFTGGLLVEKLGGPSVKPPQPSGIWEAVGYLTSNTRNFTADTGVEKVHRRSLYTFWKRTAPPPQMASFDAPSREACRVRRERTNTPLQALVLLNDIQFVECARGLAQRAMKEAGAKVDDQLTHLFRLALARNPDALDLEVLRGAYQDHLVVFRKDAAAAKKLIATGESKPDPKLDPSELAALTMIGNLVLNLDEVVTKE